jgi:hypothetical protein
MESENHGDSILAIAKDISFIMQGEMEKLSIKNGTPEGTIDGITASKIVAALTFVAAHMAMEIGSSKDGYLGLLNMTWDFIENQKKEMGFSDDAKKQTEELLNKVRGMV